MKWEGAIARALEMAVWALAPVAALGAHQAVRQKVLFLHRYQLVLANADDRTLWTDSIWRLVEGRYGFLCMAAVLIPVVCSFVLHLGLRGWLRTLIGIVVCAPALWYASVALQLFGKVITHAP